MSRAAPKPRQVYVGGYAMHQLIEGVLESRLGGISAVIETRPILESLLEEYFYGGSFTDEFYDYLSQLRIPSDQIHFLRREIITSLGEQIQMALGQMRPCNHYSFHIDHAGDVLVSEIPPPRLHRPQLAAG